MKTLGRERDLLEIQDRLKSLRPDSRARWGKMSADQMIRHLADAFRMATGDMVVAPNSNLFKRTLLKWVALYALLPWPPGVPTSPETDQHHGGTRPGEFAEDVRETEMYLALISAGKANLDDRPHPLFGVLRPPVL